MKLTKDMGSKPIKDLGSKLDASSTTKENVKQDGNQNDVKNKTNKDKSDGRKRKTCLQMFSNAIIGSLETFFYWLGCAVAKWPIFTMSVCLMITSAAGAGFIMYFYQESAFTTLWIPESSDLPSNMEWVAKRFPNTKKQQIVLVTAQNILTPKSMQKLFQMDSRIKNIHSPVSERNYTWGSLCVRVNGSCESVSILELFSYNATVINNLTPLHILYAVNAPQVRDRITRMLSDISFDGVGRINGARATLMYYFIERDSGDGLFNKASYSLSSVITDRSEHFETQFLAAVTTFEEKYAPDIDHVYYIVSKSREEEGKSSVIEDLPLVILGYILMFSYVLVVLGSCNRVHQRVYVSLAGILCVFMGIILSYGSCSWLNIFYGPIHNIIPFLVLGLGVDDMFIITHALDNLPSKYDDEPQHIKIGHALQLAGVSITVTSLTDIATFGIGVISAVPALQSFCIYVCIAIAGVYIFTTTFFVAVLSLDLKRASQSRDACCCFVIPSFKANKCSQESYMSMFFSKIYVPVIAHPTVKCIVVVLTVLLLAGGMYGTCYIQFHTDNNFFIPQGNYIRKFQQAQKTYFPTNGIPSAMFIGDIDYFSNFGTLQQLCNDIDSNEYVKPGSTTCWVREFQNWMDAPDPSQYNMVQLKNGFPQDRTDFFTLLNMFLASEKGKPYVHDVVLNSSSSHIEASRFIADYKIPTDTPTEVRAMDSLYDIAGSTGINETFPNSYTYQLWETTKIIRHEFFRNLVLALACVFALTTILLADIRSSFFTLLCVLFTLVDVIGMMYYWNLTLNNITTIQVVISIGLTIDYSAHIAHTFLTTPGTSNSARTSKTLRAIGPAVFNGGFSTFLAFVLLGGTDSLLFISFFKVMFGVSLLGLFHGLAFLPVLLSWLGPEPYWSAQQSHVYEKSNKDTGHEETDTQPTISVIATQPSSASRHAAKHRTENEIHDKSDDEEEDEYHDLSTKNQRYIMFFCIFLILAVFSIKMLTEYLL